MRWWPAFFPGGETLEIWARVSWDIIFARLLLTVAYIVFVLISANICPVLQVSLVPLIIPLCLYVGHWTAFNGISLSKLAFVSAATRNRQLQKWIIRQWHKSIKSNILSNQKILPSNPPPDRCHSPSTGVCTTHHPRPCGNQLGEFIKQTGKYVGNFNQLVLHHSTFYDRFFKCFFRLLVIFFSHLVCLYFRSSVFYFHFWLLLVAVCG